VPSPKDDAPFDDRLTANILDELRAQNALADLGLADDQLEQVAQAVAVNVDYSFEVRWSPRWEGRP
jgi:hypothetical protein